MDSQKPTHSYELSQLEKTRKNFRKTLLEKENCQYTMNLTSAVLLGKGQTTEAIKLDDQSEKGTNGLYSNRPRLSMTRPRTNTTVNGRMSLPRHSIKPEEHTKEQLDPLYSDASLLANYQIMSHIGKGSYATVSLAIEKSTQKQFAVKIYDRIAVRDPQRLENVKREIKSLKTLSHRNIVGLVHAIYDKKKIYLVMENAGKNSLHSLLRRKESKRFTEHEARTYFKQLMQAIACCHRAGICHRDIKLENILINQSNQLKLIDFGFSVNSRAKLSTYCGTPSYMAPEIAGKLSYQGWHVDMWSCGVLLYVMLCGTYPFRGLDEKQLYRKIKIGKYTFRQELNISAGAKRVIGKMLRVLPNTRIGAQQLLFDKWFDQ